MIIAQGCFRLVNPHRLTIHPDRHMDIDDMHPLVAARLDGTPAVVRMAAVRLRRTNASEVTAFINEVRALLLIKHPCMVALHGVCIERKAGLFAPIFEKVEGVPLDAYMRQKDNPVQALTRQRLAMDVCSALCYMHDQQPPIPHGQLNGSDILVESRLAGPRAKLLDYGWSALLEKQSCIELVSPFDFGRHATRALRKIMRHRGGRQRKILIWTAPEAFSVKEAAFTPSADVFVFGRLMYLVITGLEPLHGVNVKSLERAVQKRTVLPLEWPDVQPDNPQRLAMSSLLVRCQSLVERCCIPNPLLRPSMGDLFSDVRQWVPQFDMSPLYESSRSMRNESEFTAQPSVSEPAGEAPLCPQGHGALCSSDTIQAQEPSNCSYCDRSLALDPGGDQVRPPIINMVVIV
jgi:serine/threonine protein kinase